MSNGDYKQAFKSAHVRYSPSNTGDEALKTLMRQGFIPIFVDVVNTSSQTVDLARLRLTLDNAGQKLAPIPNADLPREFEKFNPTALAANVYDTGGLAAA